MTAPAGTIAVAVNLLWMTPGRVGGSEQYLTRQLCGLDRSAGCEPTLYCQPSFVDAHPDLAARFATVPLPFGRDWRGVRITAEHTWLAARTRDADVVHHGGGTAPLVGRRPVVLTVHDLQYRTHPQYFGTARRAYLAAMMPRSIRRAAVVTTPSEYVRRTVIEGFAVPPEKVLVVPHGVPEVSALNADRQREVLGRYGVDAQSFVIYPAITHPHKAHRVLVDMLDHLDPDLQLLLLGGVGAAEAELRRSIGASRHRARIVRTGRVSADDRDVLVASAAAMVFPSEYEGFGAPVVEAMALGTPVVCSDADAVREVAGDAAIVVAGASPQAWADGVAAAISRRTELVGFGAARRDDFSLAASGRALARAYRLAADRRAEP
jgi:alpha-1,3-rhamnosyl/mannosyltransferase